MYDYLVIGAGLFGSVFAHESRRKGKHVLLIDSRPHIGGNCYSERHDGIDVHKYGPHIFHTSDDRIWKFMNQFTEFNNFVFRPKVKHGNRLYSFPINLMTLHQVWGVTTPEEASRKLDEVRVPCDNPRNLEEWILSQVGPEIYETFIQGYTTKQWMRDPKDLPASIIKRLPIRLTFDDNYFNDIYQGIPKDGYTNIFKSMLQGCDVALGENYFDNRDRWNSMAKRVVYTGKIDEFFDYKFGDLEYKSLRFEEEKREGDFQGNAVVNYGEEPVNIGNTEQISIMALAQMIAEEVGYKGGNNFDRSKPDGQYEKPSSNKKLRDLGCSIQYTPLREGLKETIKSFQDRYPHVRGV